MGLDMYLTAQRYFGSYPTGDKRNRVIEAMGGDHPPFNDTPSATVQIDVAYWRKANQVHQWFVDNVQGGEDNCHKHFVPLDTIKELVTKCEELLVKRDPEQAAEELPTTSGFFFGSTDYDDDYWSDLEDTVAQLQPLLDWFGTDEKRLMDWDLHYRASW